MNRKILFKNITDKIEKLLKEKNIDVSEVIYKGIYDIIEKEINEEFPSFMEYLTKNINEGKIPKRNKM